jgi:hypothetical protein
MAEDDYHDFGLNNWEEWRIFTPSRRKMGLLPKIAGCSARSSHRRLNRNFLKLILVESM